MSRKKEDEKVKQSRESDDAGRYDTSERETGSDGPQHGEENQKAKSGKLTPELIRAAFQIQDMRDRMRSPDYGPDPRLQMEMWTWRRKDGSEMKGNRAAYIDKDAYLTGRLETEPDTIKAFRIYWEKRPQKAFTERGQDSYVFVGRHARGFILTVYPTRLVDVAYTGHAYHTWWSIRIYLEGWARELDYLVEDQNPHPNDYYVNAQGEKVYKAASYMYAMLGARGLGDKWKYDLNNPLFPVSTHPMKISDSNPLNEPGDLLYLGDD